MVGKIFFLFLVMWLLARSDDNYMAPVIARLELVEKLKNLLLFAFYTLFRECKRHIYIVITCLNTFAG